MTAQSKYNEINYLPALFLRYQHPLRPFFRLSYHREMAVRLWGTSLILCAVLASAGIVEDVRSQLAYNNFAPAELVLSRYRAQHGEDPEYLEALSWMARASLSANQFDQASKFATQTESGVRTLLQRRVLDADEHLPIALGAALEVQAGVLSARGQNSEAVALLRHGLAVYGNTSIRARLQKNLNLLALTGQPAPALSLTEYLGPKPVALTQKKGSPVLLFFWAHWCVDCKSEGPIIARLSSEFASRGLSVLAPTQLYGYAAQGEDAKPKDELAYIQQVWQHYYSGLQNVPVPVSKANFNNSGASTTPTLVLVDRAGKVALYHPGVLPYEELREVIEKTLTN